MATGNHIYGAFGRDFGTRDGRRVMIAAMTTRQWAAITAATGLAERLALIEPMLDVDLSTDGGRYTAREAIATVLAPWFAQRTLAEIEDLFNRYRVLYGVYRDFAQLVHEDPRCSTANPLFTTLHQPGIGDVLAPRSPLTFAQTTAARPAPTLGEHTEQVLTEHLKCPKDEIRDLAARGIIATAPCDP